MAFAHTGGQERKYLGDRRDMRCDAIEDGEWCCGWWRDRFVDLLPRSATQELRSLWSCKWSVQMSLVW